MAKSQRNNKTASEISHEQKLHKREIKAETRTTREPDNSERQKGLMKTTRKESVILAEINADRQREGDNK